MSENVAAVSALGGGAAPAAAELAFELVDILNPGEKNFILGQAHFIKTGGGCYVLMLSCSKGSRRWA